MLVVLSLIVCLRVVVETEVTPSEVLAAVMQAAEADGSTIHFEQSCIRVLMAAIERALL